MRNNLKFTLSTEGLTYNQLAKMIGHYSAQYIYNIVKDINYPSLPVALRLAQVLNKKVEDIFYLTQEDIEDFESKDKIKLKKRNNKHAIQNKRQRRSKKELGQGSGQVKEPQEVPASA